MNQVLYAINDYDEHGNEYLRNVKIYHGNVILQFPTLSEFKEFRDQLNIMSPQIENDWVERNGNDE